MTTKGKAPQTCNGCGAPVKWIKMRDTGARMILDDKPLQMVRVIPKDELFEDGPKGVMIKVYQPHWGTCPKSKQFKKEKKGESHDAPGQHGKAHKSGQQSLI